MICLQYVKKKKIDYIYCNKINDKKNITWLKKKKPDYIFCFGWSELLSQRILDIPKKGIIGYHPSLLPKNRGRHPIIWSLILGLKYIGSTFFLMTNKADKGPVIDQKKIKVLKNDNSTKIYKKLIKIANLQLKEIILKIITNKKFKQKKISKKIDSNYWRKRSIKDGIIDWRMDAENIINLTKALSKPYPFSHFYFKAKKIEVIRVKKIKFNNKNFEPGKIIDIKNKNHPVVKCGKNALEIIKYKPKHKFMIGDYLI